MKKTNVITIPKGPLSNEQMAYEGWNKKGKFVGPKAWEDFKKTEEFKNGKLNQDKKIKNKKS